MRARAGAAGHRQFARGTTQAAFPTGWRAPLRTLVHLPVTGGAGVAEDPVGERARRVLVPRGGRGEGGEAKVGDAATGRKGTENASWTAARITVECSRNGLERIRRPPCAPLILCALLLVGFLHTCAVAHIVYLPPGTMGLEFLESLVQQQQQNNVCFCGCNFSCV